MTSPAILGADRMAALGRTVPFALLLAVAVPLGMLTNWWVATGAVVVGLLLLWRPFEPMLFFVLAAAAASFVNDGAGHLTRDLSVVVFLALCGLAGIVLLALTQRWALPVSPLTWGVALMGALMFTGVVHGILAGNSLRYMGLEVLPLSSLALGVVLGGMRVEARGLRWTMVLLSLTAVGQTAMGVMSYALFRVRTGGVFFTPFTAIFGLLLLNLILYDSRKRWNLPLILLFSMCMVHQLISFTRGYWLGLLIAIPYSCVVYAAGRSDTRRRWIRLARMFLLIGMVVVVGIVVAGFAFGWTNPATLLGTRLASSVGTQQSTETASNIARLVEYWGAIQRIGAAPWFGYGLGYTLHVREPIFSTVTSQWYVHQTYLWAWLKLGVFGLAALLAMLWISIREGTRQARRLTGVRAAWGAAAAATTIHMAVVGLTNFSLVLVNGTITMALIWGVAHAMRRPDLVRITWRSRRTATRGGEVAPSNASG